MLPDLQAEQQLQRIEAAVVPHMDADGHRDTIRKYTRLLHVDREQARDRNAAAFAQLGVPVEFVPKKVKPDG